VGSLDDPALAVNRKAALNRTGAPLLRSRTLLGMPPRLTGVLLAFTLSAATALPALAQTAPVASATPAPAPATGSLDRAYAAIAAGQYAVARPLIEEHLAAEPGDAKAWHQLAYTDEALKDYPAALVALDRYLTLVPGDDNARLEKAYNLVNAGRPDEAEVIFGQLRTASDPVVAKKAQAEWQARQPQRPAAFDLFGYTFYDSRFLDTFYGFDLTHPFTAKPIAPYAILHVTGDTRTGTGQNAQIFTDNAAVTDVGVRAKIAPGTILFAQGGVGIGLRDQGTISDVRYGIASSQQWGRLTNGLTLDASAATYSRYAGNTIAYLNVRKTIPLGGTFAFIFGIEGALDAQRLYYNNYVNEVAGIQFGTPWIKVRIEGYYGSYLGRGLDQPASTTYSAFRPATLFGSSF
jgi:tetratricopeptide (TPR) repeat protein